MRFKDIITGELKQKFNSKNKFVNLFFQTTLIPFLRSFSKCDEYEKLVDVTLNGLSMSNPEDLEKIFEKTGIKVQIHYNEEDIVLKKNQVMIVSNHPTGPTDGAFSHKTLHALNLRGKVLGDDVLSGLDILKDGYIGISLRGDGKTRLAQLKNLKKQVLSGSSLVMFPSGEVSKLNLEKRKVIDSPWKSGFIEIAKSNNLQILPIYIDSNLSLFYYVLNKISADVASLSLLKETLNFIKVHQNDVINVYVGKTIDPESLETTEESALMIKNYCENLKYCSYKNHKG